jgi:aryl-alcohol dehydrogenase-like predicted oxidoreductase
MAAPPSAGPARLALGTVQFGRPYGVSNAAGQTPESEVAAILALARKDGIDTLDTAPGYGDAEAVLGRVLGGDPHFRIITKTPVLKDMGAGRTAADAVRATLEGSLERLARGSVGGLIVHLADDLLGADGDAIWAAMAQAKAEGLVERIGASAYRPEEVAAMLVRYPLELVQVPFSAFDQRCRAAGTFAALEAMGVEVHARSAFLQGLLLMDPDRLPAGFSRAQPAVRAFRRAAVKAGLSPLALALRIALGQPGIGRVVLGVTRAAELVEILAAAQGERPPGLDIASLAVADDAVITPSLWPPDDGKKWTFNYGTAEKAAP